MFWIKGREAKRTTGREQKERRVFEGESEGSSWRKIKALMDNYVKAKSGESKQKIGNEIKNEYEKLVERLNSIDEKIAHSHIEKAICIEALRVLQTILNEKLDPNEKMIQNKKLKGLDKESENLYFETDKQPKVFGSILLITVKCRILHIRNILQVF